MKLLIISIPLLSSFSIFFLGRYIGQIGGKIISIISIMISGIISFISLKDYLFGKTYTILIKEWFEIGQMIGKMELIMDKESILMNNLISLITLVIIVYSYWYLAEDPKLNTFISKLLIFAVSMYILVSSKNFLFSFFGWELVGIVSYLLINFWSISIQNNKCAIKALIFNKIGDIFYLFGLLIMGIIFYSFDYNYINNYSNIIHNPTLYSILIFVFIIAAMAKSAQIILHCWLGDAMAGPTPVSALLHAATMVTAGIFILLRCNILLENSLPIITSFINIIGSLTILFAGLSALSQNDIKKIIAYSTCSQIGFMFFALSLSKPINSSLYHLITHGFFKALLFLSAGLIIHSFLLEQDLRKFGNLIFKAPLFYIFFLIGSIAIMGIPSLSGFYSKDLILIHSIFNSSYSYILLIIGSLLSSLYSIKILYYTFFNNNNIYSSFKTYHFLNNYSFLIPFFIILSGSIFLGNFSNNFFASPETLNLDLEYTLYNNDYYYIYILIPFLLPILAILIFFLYLSKRYLFNQYFYIFYSLFNRKLFFDTFYNYFILKYTFIISYHYTYKFIDRGLLEIFGPISLFRLFFFFPKYYNLSSQYSSNIPYIFFYFFFSIILLLIPILFII